MKQQAILILIYVALLALHALAFKTPQISWGEALGRWQGLYVVYFLVTCLIVERVGRRRHRQDLPPPR